MATVNVGGKNIPLVVAKHDKTLSSMQPGQKYAPPQVITAMTRTGLNGQVISLWGTNGLTDASYIPATMSEYDARASMPQAFDGVRMFSAGPNNPALVTNPEYVRPGSVADYHAWRPTWTADTYFQVDFNQVVEGISGFRVVMWNNMPFRNLKIQKSEDGVTFTDHESFAISNSTDQTFVFENRMTTKHFRAVSFGGGAWGGEAYVSEFEINQNPTI